MCNFVKEFFARDWTKEEKVLVVSTIGLAGMLAGILLSPLKGGWKMFSDNGCNNANNNDNAAHALAAGKEEESEE